MNGRSMNWVGNPTTEPGGVTEVEPVIDIRQVHIRKNLDMHRMSSQGIVRLSRRLTHGETSMRVVVVMQCESDLLHVVLALSSSSRFTGLLHGRQQQGNQNRNDRNHDQQFNQRKSLQPTSTE